jgi:type IV fimbrial biogenesis protein FimT
MRQLGLTLVELITVLAIAAILSMAAVPSFVSLIAGHRIKAAASTLQLALLTARSESVKRNGNVRVAPATADQWNEGWRVINVADNATIASYPATSALFITGPAAVTYQPSGRVTMTALPPFRVSSAQVTEVRCVVVNATGMPAVASSGC